MDQTKNLAIHEWGLDSTRGYVGPKGWKTTRSSDDKLWRMKHRSYHVPTLTMLDVDALPIGRHQWMVEKNVCNQGEISVENLLISVCKEDQFTCDDGKCLEIGQRCYDIEECDNVSDEKIVE